MMMSLDLVYSISYGIRSLKCDLSPFYFTLMEVSSMSVITNQLDLLSDVLEDFCTKYNLECMSADDILYGSSDNELTNYQKDWLRNYISIWDTIANL